MVYVSNIFSAYLFLLLRFFPACNFGTISDNQIPQLVDDGAKIDRYLFGRHVPLEKKEMYLAKKKIENDLLNDQGVR